MRADVEVARRDGPVGAHVGDVAGAADDVDVARVGEPAREGRQRGVVATAEDRHVARQPQLPGDRRQDLSHGIVGLHDRGQPLRRQAGGVEDRGIPGQVVPCRGIEARDRRRRGVDGPAPGQAPGEVRVAVTEDRRRRPDLGLVVPDPQDAGQGRAPRDGQVAGLCQETLLADGRPDLGRLGARATVEEEDGGTQRGPIGRHRREPRRRHGERQDPHTPKVVGDLGAGLADGRPPGGRCHVRLVAVVEVDLVVAPCDGALLEVRAEDPQLEAAGADVDGEDVAPHHSSPSFTSDLLQRCPLRVVEGQQGAARDAAHVPGQVHGGLHAGDAVAARDGVVDARDVVLECRAAGLVACHAVRVEPEGDSGEGVGQRDGATGRAGQHGREEEVGGAREHGEARSLQLEEGLDPRGRAVLHAHDPGMGRQPVHEPRLEGQPVEARRVVQQERQRRGVGQRGEVAVEDLVGHLLAEVAGREDQPDVGPQVRCRLQEALGLPLPVIGRPGHDDLAGTAMANHDVQDLEPLLLAEAAVLPVGAEGQVPVDPRGGIARQVVPERPRIDVLIRQERCADRREDPGQRGRLGHRGTPWSAATWSALAPRSMATAMAVARARSPNVSRWSWMR